jgi:nicotinamidase-related amidase
MMRVWDKFLTEEDKKVFEASGYGSRGGFAKRPAVIVVDVNYAFTGEHSEPILESIKKWRNSCGSAGWDAIPHIRSLVTSARENRIPVFYSTGTDPREDRFDRGAWSFKNRRNKEDRNTVVAGVRGNDIVKEIAPAPFEFLIEKLKPSVFFGTPLIGYLTELNVDTLLVCGTTTSGCVRATVLDAFNLNYHISIVEECTFDRFESSHAINLFDMNAKYADVIGVDEATDYMRGVGRGLYDEKIGFPARETAKAGI